MFKQIANIMRKPSAAQLAQVELEDARRELLAAEAGRDYAAAMVAYNAARIARLESMLRQEVGNA